MVVLCNFTSQTLIDNWCGHEACLKKAGGPITFIRQCHQIVIKIETGLHRYCLIYSINLIQRECKYRLEMINFSGVPAILIISTSLTSSL